MSINTITRNLSKDCRDSGFASGSVCPYCKAERIVKHGKLNGRQRFRCKRCGKTFNGFSLSALANTKLSMTKWLEHHRNGIYHISHMNRLHSLLKGWLRPFNCKIKQYRGRQPPYLHQHS